MSELEFFNYANVALLIMAGFMILYSVFSFPITTTRFASFIRFVAIMVSAVVLVVGAFNAHKELKFAESGLIVNADIKSMTVSEEPGILGKIQPVYRIRYKFNDSRGMEYSGSVAVDKFTFEMAKLDVNNKFKVEYLKEDPSTSRADGSTEWGRTIGMIATGLIGLASTLFVRRKVYYYRKMEFEQEVKPYKVWF